MKNHRALFAVVGLAFAWPVVAGAVDEMTPGYFAFNIPVLDSAASFTDMSSLNPEAAGAAGPVTIRDGHFVDGHGQRLRLFGANLCFAANFPDKEDAPKVAAHLRKMGVNVIRLHHTDGGTTPKGFWLADRSGIDPAQMDRYDWLIYNLKQQGIYVDVNVHIARTYPGTSKDVPYSFRYGKALDNFHRPYIDELKNYARALLTHRNPYTKATYAEEPAVAVVEINNENALTSFSPEALKKLPEPYMGELTRLWNDWLKARYKDTATLRERWSKADEKPGEEMLKNGDFSKGDEGWKQEANEGAKMKVEVGKPESVNGEAAPGGQALKITTLEKGKQAFNLQYQQGGFKLVPGRLYTLSFWARAAQPCDISVVVRQDGAPYKTVGLSQDASLTGQWRQEKLVFRSQAAADQACRVAFNFKNQIGEFYLAAISLRAGGEMSGLAKDQSLEAGNVPIPFTSAAVEQRQDYGEFLADIERRYVSEMIGYLKRDLGVKASVTNTQATYGGLWGAKREAELSDYLDVHAYWQHPKFPGKPWDPANWTIGNTSMVADGAGGALAGRAWFRDIGKPFTFSEYNHAAPSDYSAEMFPMFASFAAFQDWDGIFAFTWQSQAGNTAPQKIEGYFDIRSHPGKTAFMPIAALMFRLGGVEAGRDPLVATVPTGDFAKQAALVDGKFKSATDTAAAAIVRPAGFRLTAGTGPVQVPEYKTPEGKRVSSTGQIEWDATDPKKATYTINAPAVRLAVGYIGGREIKLGDAAIRVTKAANDWAALAIGALDGKPIAESSRVLVVAVGRVENTNMGWDEKRTTVGKNWGGAPVVCEGIEATVRLPGVKRLVALDGTGAPGAEVKPAAGAPNSAEFQIGPQYKTLWYAGYAAQR